MCLIIIKPMLVELDITHRGVFVSSFWAICSCDKLLSMVLVLRQYCTFYYDDPRSSPKKLDFSVAPCPSSNLPATLRAISRHLLPIRSLRFKNALNQNSKRQ
jgi:hypothetical protein